MKFKTFRNLVIAGVVVVGGGTWAVLAMRSEPAKTPPHERPIAGGPARAIPVPAAAPAGAPHEAFLTARLGTPADKDKFKDAMGGGAVKVNVYAEGGQWMRAKVDLDRDDKWDEKWELKDGMLSRQIASADDEKYDRTLQWNGSAWAGPEAAPAPVASGDLRPVDQAMLSLMKGNAQKKVKDATKGQPFKINLYSDDGKRFARAKVDLDRDDKWDEKWTFKADGSIEREVAPADDEAYTEHFELSGSAWARK